MSTPSRETWAALTVLLLACGGPLMSDGPLASAGRLAAQSLTGPGKEAKPTVAAHSAPSSSLGASDWLYWSEDEILDRFLFRALGPEGLGAYPPSRRVELKVAMGKVDARVRDALAAMARGSMSEQAARDTIEGVLLEYALFLGSLAGQR